MTTSKLTAKQKKFVDEYLIDLNATQAAIRAGYSEKTARQVATENLSKPNIQKYLQQRQSRLQEKTEITQERVLNELAAVAFANASDFAQIVTKKGKDLAGNEVEYKGVDLTETDKLPKDKLPALAGIKQGANGIEVKLNDKLKALELVGKHIGMFNEKIELSGNVNNPFEGMTTDQLKKLIDDG